MVLGVVVSTALRAFAQSHPQSRNWRLRDDRSMYQRIDLAMERRQYSVVGIARAVQRAGFGRTAMKQRHDAFGRDEDQRRGQDGDDEAFAAGQPVEDEARLRNIAWMGRLGACIQRSSNWGRRLDWLRFARLLEGGKCCGVVGEAGQREQESTASNSKKPRG